METQELVSKYFPLIKKHWLPLSLGILGMIFFAYGLIGLFSADKSSEDIVFEASERQNSVEIKTILVDVEGAVVKPGVYKLPQESRIQDGLVAAGGLSAQADREYISKNLNLATKLADGSKVYIPFIGEAVSGAGVLSATSKEAGGALININTASQSQLEALPGRVGPKTAEKIISGRPYNSIDELLSKKVVSASVFGQIKDKISVY